MPGLKFSIITPSLNQSSFIEQTILSVTEQQQSNLEYIIIDGGSTDGSVEIIRKHEPQLAFWCSETDAGQSNAINKGLVKISGDIFNWINSDDYYEPHVFKKIEQEFQDPAINVFCGITRQFVNPSKFHFSAGTKIYQNNLSKTIGWLLIDQPATFFRTSTIRKLGPLNEKLNYLMDAEWWLKHLLYSGLEGISKKNIVIANFRLHPTSKTISQNNRFNIERDSIFHALALELNLPHIAKQIKSTQLLLNDYQLHLNHTLHPEIRPLAIFSYYFLLLGNEYYIKHDKKLAALYLNIADPKFLHPEDKQYLNKLTFRNRYLPKFIIDLFRKQIKN